MTRSSKTGKAPNGGGRASRSAGRRGGVRGELRGDVRGDIEGLLHRLRRAPSKPLLALVEEHGRELTLRELRQILLNPYADGEVLGALASNRKLTAMQEARAAIARHRRTPEPMAMRLIPNLFWRDLAEITLDLRIRASVRRVAERYLTQRLPRLAEGEKINLARRSVEAVAAALIAEDRPRITAAGLDNPRLSEGALLDLITGEGASPRLLDHVAAHPRWGSRYEVRAALCRNAKTPYRVVLPLLETLRGEELERVAANEHHASFLRAAAGELARGRARRGAIGLESSPQDSPEPFLISGVESPPDSNAHGGPADSETAGRPAARQPADDRSPRTYEKEKAKRRSDGS